MVGGTQDQLHRWGPVLQSLGQEPRLVGPVGQAAALKLALNQLIAAEITAFSLSLGLIQRSGVSVDLFMSILKESALFAPVFEKKLPRLQQRQYDHPNFFHPPSAQRCEPLFRRGERERVGDERAGRSS